jgi:hypothetical protein
MPLHSVNLQQEKSCFIYGPLLLSTENRGVQDTSYMSRDLNIVIDQVFIL